MSSHSRASLPRVNARLSLTSVSSSGIFYGLNAVRALSIVALLLAFSGNIIVVVSDIRAVNQSQHDPNSDNGSCGYIACASSLGILYVVILMCLP